MSRQPPRSRPAEDRLTVWISTQTPHAAQRLLCDLLGLDEAQVRVITPDVGGGFGPKLVFYPEEVIVIARSRAAPAGRSNGSRTAASISSRRRRSATSIGTMEMAHRRRTGASSACAARLLHDHGAYARGVNLPYEFGASGTLAYMSARLSRWT